MVAPDDGAKDIPDVEGQERRTMAMAAFVTSGIVTACVGGWLSSAPAMLGGSVPAVGIVAASGAYAMTAMRWRRRLESHWRTYTLQWYEPLCKRRAGGGLQACCRYCQSDRTHRRVWYRSSLRLVLCAQCDRRLYYA